MGERERERARRFVNARGRWRLRRQVGRWIEAGQAAPPRELPPSTSCLRMLTGGDPEHYRWRLRRQLGRWIPHVAPPRDVGRYNECRADMYQRTVASVHSLNFFFSFVLLSSPELSDTNVFEPYTLIFLDPEQPDTRNVGRYIECRDMYQRTVASVHSLNFFCITLKPRVE